MLSLYALLIWRTLRILVMAKDLFGSLVAAGVVAMLMFQVFVNVGMTHWDHAHYRRHAAAHELWRLVGDHHPVGGRPAAIDLRPGARLRRR